MKRRADPKVRHRLRTLDRGESTALEAAIQANGVILLDEKLGREMAKYYSVKLIGTVGVLLLGKQRGHMELVMPKINQLRCSGYYLGDTLIRQVRQLADE